MTNVELLVCFDWDLVPGVPADYRERIADKAVAQADKDANEDAAVFAYRLNRRRLPDYTDDQGWERLR